MRVFRKRLTRYLGERKALADVPNVLGYQRVIETSTNGYLVRQYLYSSLYDRMRCALPTLIISMRN